MPYDHRSVEPKWQARWREARLHQTTFDPQRPKFYALDMFPYPSARVCTWATARLHRHRHHHTLEAHAGLERLHPMGWDAFGLPAENYAIKTGIHPRVTTEKAIANFRRQIDSTRLCLRLGSRDQHHRSPIREVDAVDLLAALQEGPGLRGHGAHQLVPLVQDRAGQ